MTRRLPAIAAWLLGGHALLLALFWGLLNVPESSVWMLALSVLTIGVLVVAAGTVHAGTAAAWQQPAPVWRALASGLRHVPAFVVAALVFCVFWWATSQAFDLHARVSGQIDAWYIARTGRSDTTLPHGAIHWGLQFLRWSLGLTIALSLLAALVGRGWRALRTPSWLKEALRPRRWLTVTLWLVVLVALPLQVVDWRPAHLSLALEPWFVAAKLSGIALAASIGWALMVRACAMVD